MSQLEGQLKNNEADKQSVQSELDDLLMVYSDLEEKAKQYKVGFSAGSGFGFLCRRFPLTIMLNKQDRLRSLGETVSDGEDEDGDGDDDRDEDDGVEA